MATFGKNILENLTTGMYSDSKIAYREYIQNACDQINEAVKQGIISKEDGLVDIYVDNNKRSISIEDNGTSISATEFRDKLYNIADSDKNPGENMGFRGIGRLCGLAYCKTLKFTASYPGESEASVMIWDAKLMREMLNASDKFTATEVLDAIVRFETEKTNPNDRFFRVELLDINPENTELLNVEIVREYLSFVAPVPYKNTFIYREKIHKYVKNEGFALNEFCIKVNSTAVLKNYKTTIRGSNENQNDDIFDVDFHKFIDDSGNVLAWCWIGLSELKAVIPSKNAMRGIRLRQSNIQIGNDDALKKFFPEDRGTYYYIGEIFAIADGLRPNSQRDYFNETETRNVFEYILEDYFKDLGKYYRYANKYKNAVKKQKKVIEIKQEFDKKQKNKDFVGNEQETLSSSFEQAKIEAEVAQKEIDKLDKSDPETTMGKITQRIKDNSKASDLTATVNTTKIKSVNGNKKSSNITQKLSKLDKKQRKTVEKIFIIIHEIAPKDLSEELIKKITEELS